MCICRSSGGTKGGSESEADPFVQSKSTYNIKYDNFAIKPIFLSILIIFI